MIITHGGVLPDSAQKTDFYAIIDQATASSIIDADISSGANISDTKLAPITTAGKVNVSALVGSIANSLLAQLVNAGLVSGAALVNLDSIPAGAGLVPIANIGSLFGASVSKNIGTTYQATTDGIVTALVSANSAGNAGYVRGFTDSNSSPSTLMGQASVCSPNSAQADHTVLYNSFSMRVKNNDYYVVNTGVFGAASQPATSMYFQPIGS